MYLSDDIFEDGDFILSNYTFGSWFLVRVPESRCDLNNYTFKGRCYCNVDIFEDRDFILSNDTFGSWFLVRVPENRCYYNVNTFEVCHCTDGHQEDKIASTSWPRSV